MPALQSQPPNRHLAMVAFSGAFFLALSLLLLLSACAFDNGMRVAERFTRDSGFVAIQLNSPELPLAGWLKDEGDAGPLFVYIEGDGLAYLSRFRPASDPTPRNPVALKLALIEPAGRVLYLARPCQYISPVESCHPALWTLSRFSPVVVEAISNSLDQVKKKSGADELVLIGFSGGGALAALVAAGRDDVLMLVTVAGNLDHRLWTDHHRVSPLLSSLNPVDYASGLSVLPQIHYVGERDQVVPPMVAESFLVRLGPAAPARIVRVPKADHLCCWQEFWPALRKKMDNYVGKR